MKLYVGVTDRDWFEIVKKEQCDEVNFWKPGTGNFRALSTNDLFLFKLHAPYNYIVGGGYFVKFSIIPTYMAWNAFGIKNGTYSLKQLNDRISKYRSRNSMSVENPQIGCIILTERFFFDEADWIPAPSDWKNSIVQGKTYDTNVGVGKEIYEDITSRLKGKTEIIEGNSNEKNLYIETLTKHRLGQGAFRVSVADAYQRRCAITGEKTLPVLEAAHIKPYSKDGPHLVPNGILLKSDFHTLYDDGYITIDINYRVDVSRRLHEDYGNGKDYYKYHGKKLMVMPENIEQFPLKKYLEWHNENVFLG